MYFRIFLCKHSLCLDFLLSETHLTGIIILIVLTYRCNVVPFTATGQLGAVAMDCDRVVFHGEAPQLPYGAPIVSYSQRFSGQQVLPAAVSRQKALD